MEQLFEQLMEYMSAGDYGKALSLIKESLSHHPNDYELYYSYALCLEQLGQVEDAYFAYKLAIYFGKKSADRELLEQRFRNLCSYAGANAYELGKACERVVKERLDWKEYENTYGFLGEQLYDTNRFAAKIVLTEENMLLYMLLEIVLCEKNHMSVQAFAMENSCVVYHNDVGAFMKVYQQIKFMVRRIWFGFGVEQQKELNDLLNAHIISSDMLAVIAKYSVPQEYWVDTFSRLQAVVQYQHPAMGRDICIYTEWLNTQEIGKQIKCENPAEYNNHAQVIRLEYDRECQKKEWQKKDCQKKDCWNQKPETEATNTNGIAVIFCTNHEGYAKECVEYIRRLRIPEGKTLKVIQVWNASGMAAGYNMAMGSCDARYKLYIHHDTFLIQEDMLEKLVDAFDANEHLGLIGIFGSTSMQDSALWYKSSWEESRLNLYQDAVLKFLMPSRDKREHTLDYAEAVDGVLIATSKDVIWREDLFDGWHFYDISQGYEFRKHHYETAFYNDSKAWALHETTMRKDSKDAYGAYRKIFQKHYLLPVQSEE